MVHGLGRMDVPRRRIALSLRLDDTPGEKVEAKRGGERPSQNAQRQAQRNNPAPASTGSLGALLQQAMKKK